MKTKQTLGLFFTLFVLLTSCKKSDTPATDTPIVKKLKYLSEMSSTTNGVTITYKYTYDDKKRISKSVQGESVTTFTYRDDKIFLIESVTPSTEYKQTRDYIYKDGALLSVTVTTFRGNFSTYVSYNYHIENGKVTQAHHESIYVDTYTYDSKGNVVKVFLPQYNNTLEYTYDDKKSRYTNGWPVDVGFDVNWISPNNQITRPNVTTTYTYDADGFPLTATAVSKTTGTATSTSNITYTYIEL